MQVFQAAEVHSALPALVPRLLLVVMFDILFFFFNVWQPGEAPQCPLKMKYITIGLEAIQKLHANCERLCYVLLVFFIVNK